MSKRQAKSHASSSRAAFSTSSAFGTSSPSAFATTSSALSYVTEPPDLSAISDPNLVVYFRNLQKRDSTTKAKALEDLQTYISSLEGSVEEAVLEAWIKAFPRISIDNSRRVRQLAFSLHGKISASAGKRVAKFMPKAIGAWLTGLYDSDRATVQAAQDSLKQVFNTPEKIQNVRKAYKKPILEYCRDAMLNETALTLSDERTVSPDDAEAKYSRVISACTSVIGSLLNNLTPEDIADARADYNSLLEDAKIWVFASNNDPSVRRAFHKFLKTCISKQPDLLEPNLDLISKAYLANGLHSDQTGSSYDYVEALAQLTEAFPQVWTSHYKSKTTVQKRLRQFLKRGSQSGPREFWDQVGRVLRLISKGVIPNTAAEISDVLNSMHGGITNKDEPRPNIGSAFGVYLDIAGLLCGSVNDDDKYKVLSELVLPIISQYLRPEAENAQWTLPPNNDHIVRKAMTVDGMDVVLRTEWINRSSNLIERIQTSAPEQSKDFESSQKAIIDHARRFATLQESVVSADKSSPLRSVFISASSSIISEALVVLKSRNAKPYGAAGAIAEVLNHSKHLSLSSTAYESLFSFVRDDLSDLFLSPSSPHLAQILFFFSGPPFFKDVWSACLKTVLAAPDSPRKISALESLLRPPKPDSSLELAAADQELQSYMKSTVAAALNGSAEWDAFGRILRHASNALSDSTTVDILSEMTESLTITDRSSSALHGFHQVVKQNPTFLKMYLATPNGSNLFAQLLSASESPQEEIAQAASSVYASVQALLNTGSGSKQSMYDVIHNGLLNASEGSISIETLVDLAKQLLNTIQEEEIENVLPKISEWDDALSPFLHIPPKRSLAFANPLGGVVYLISPNSGLEDVKKVPRDAEGYSPAFRIGQFMTKLLNDAGILDKLSPSMKQAALQRIAITRQLAGDNLGLAGANHLWADYSHEVETDVMAFMDETQAAITNQLKELSSTWGDDGNKPSLLSWAMDWLKMCPSDTSHVAYYSARMFSELISEAIELSGWHKSSTAELQDTLKTARKNFDIITLSGFLNAFKDPLSASRSCERMCNEFVADLTYADIEQKQKKSFQQLVLLNLILEGQDGIAQTIAKPRLVSFVKHVVPWLQNSDIPLSIRAEISRTLICLLPLMSDIYDSLWATILESLAEAWSKPKELAFENGENGIHIPFLHASLKLYAQLQLLTSGEDPNDDLLDAWKDSEEAIANGLLSLLKHTHHVPDEFHQPLKVVNELLARQIAKIPLKHLESAEDLYPLLYVDSQPVQQTAFNILHRQIPARQEQISIDVAIEKSTARLPEELLSLILEAPTMEALAGANFDRSIPLPLRGYLLSWILVFDHLEHASYKVKSDYVEHMKDGDYAPGLFSFTFDFLGLSKNRPLDVSKFDVTTYTPDLEPPRQDLQWLLAHLYFLCLRYIPSIAKSWWIDCKVRPVVVNLEAWTEKYISPPVIAAALDTVTEWTKTQESSDPDSPFSVKVSPRARELTASYTLDDQTMTMRISLPPSFPLSNALVEGLSRLAVDEKKWKSWLRISQGVITFSNGNLVDGLTTFKRNVEGALKGQTECAICYSVLGPDRRVPEKRCGTCKHLFHGWCLFRWFRTSGGSSCPLCRNAFHYG